ncbi:KDP operon transcriptional regulatory protein KdpE [Neomoorella glycerini]|uniref:Stage 0 sporulation protein A homolog n=1 Tax=Neomoorella glycerini TaxID=55779 RepID=A0A6I5ZVM7_9FIRM|nr:response regulator [Moorella glycerini]QGP93914.1 KDP operon transcriptional regulatory protein KdpE [Moorella glycerini]
MTANGARVLIIDDELPIRRLLKVALAAYGYELAEASSGQEGLQQAAVLHPDLIILDLGLPDVDGLEVIKRLREWSQAPIIILSVREQESEKIKALDAGADDYVTKPFSMGELLARMRVAWRHAAKTTDEPVLSLGELTIDLAHRLVKMKGREVKLTPIEYEILKNLALHAGRVLTHHHLLRTIWGPEYEEETHYLRVYIGQLRRKIEPDPANPRYIITEPGVGYRLAVKEEGANPC